MVFPSCAARCCDGHRDDPIVGPNRVVQHGSHSSRVGLLLWGVANGVCLCVCGHPLVFLVVKRSLACNCRRYVGMGRALSAWRTVKRISTSSVAAMITTSFCGHRWFPSCCTSCEAIACPLYPFVMCLIRRSFSRHPWTA
jgi:hypothetical protein